jgi:hypothetical protein
LIVPLSSPDIVVIATDNDRSLDETRGDGLVEPLRDGDPSHLVGVEDSSLQDIHFVSLRGEQEVQLLSRYYHCGCFQAFELYNHIPTGRICARDMACAQSARSVQLRSGDTNLQSF